MINFIIGAVIFAIVALSARYIYKEKKKGNTCIGCPHSGHCGGNCGKKEQ